MIVNTIRFDNKNFVELEEVQKIIKENEDLRLQIYELQTENRVLDATIDDMNNKFEDKLALLNEEHQLLSKYDNNLIMELERRVFRLENELRKATTLSLNNNNTIEYTVVK